MVERVIIGTVGRQITRSNNNLVAANLLVVPASHLIYHSDLHLLETRSSPRAHLTPTEHDKNNIFKPLSPI